MRVGNSAGRGLHFVFLTPRSACLCAGEAGKLSPILIKKKNTTHTLEGGTQCTVCSSQALAGGRAAGREWNLCASVGLAK